MFLGTGERKIVHANKDNIEYYNKIYEEGKSEAAKIAEKEKEAYVKAH